LLKQSNQTCFNASLTALCLSGPPVIVALMRQFNRPIGLDSVLASALLLIAQSHYGGWW